MKIIFCDNLWQGKWDEFVKTNSVDFGLLQSWVWGQFQESLGKKIFRLAAVDEAENILAATLVIKNNLKLGKSYFYLPRGPIFTPPQPSPYEGEGVTQDFLPLHKGEVRRGYLLSEIKNLAQKENAIFLRLEPAIEDNEASRQALAEMNFQFIGQVQPKQTLILDINRPEAEILAQMKSKTRYNIKVAQNHNIQIDEGEKYFSDFWRLTRKTAARDQFVAHPKDYYEKMLAVLGKEGILKLIVAKAENKVIAANLAVFFGSWGVYLHGASDYRHRNLMAPYLLQWQAILEAKKAGCQFYDFWGVAENKWPGVTRFKTGFAPQNNFTPWNKDGISKVSSENYSTGFTEYVGAWDEVYSKFWYNLYRMFRKF